MNLKWLLLACAATLLVPPTAAQMTENGFTGDSHLRAAFGDVPLSPAAEADGRWNVVEYQRLHHAGGPLIAGFAMTPGFAVDGATCTCGNVSLQHAVAPAPSTGVEQVTASNVPAGVYVVSLTYHRDGVGGPGLPQGLLFTPAAGPWTATLYLRSDQTVLTGAAQTQDLPGADHPEYRIHEYAGSDRQAFFELNGAPVVTPMPASATNPWLFAASGFIFGCIVWYFLVSRGVVQRRTRKQVASTAAHVEAAQNEALPILEGRKRALMAALKEIEMARQADELDLPTYDTLKAELKKETVTVMRAIDESSAKKA